MAYVKSKETLAKHFSSAGPHRHYKQSFIDYSLTLLITIFLQTLIFKNVFLSHILQFFYNYKLFNYQFTINF